MRKILLILIILFVGAVAYKKISTDKNNEPTQVNKIAKVRVKQYTTSNTNLELQLTGVTQAGKVVDLRARTAGTIASIKIKEGTLLKQGDELFALSQDDRLNNLKQAEADVDYARSRYNNSVKLNKRNFKSKTAVDNDLANLRRAQAALKKAKLDIEYTNIKSPFDGVLQEVFIEAGDYLKIGDNIAKIIQTNPFLVVANVTEKQINQVKLGSAAVIKTINGKEFLGEVSYISKIADPRTRTFKVEALIYGEDTQFFEGMTVQIAIPLDNVNGHLIKQSFLVLDDDGIIGIRAVEQDIVKFYPVQLIKETPNGVWVGDLPDTVNIITNGQAYVRKGSKVQAVAESLY